MNPDVQLARELADAILATAQPDPALVARYREARARVRKSK